MKNIQYYLLSLLLISCCSVGAQDKFWKNVTVRKAFESGTSDDYLPATASLTIPKDGPTSYLINTGVGYSVDRNEELHSDLTGFFVYNRNTLTDLEQKNYKLGLSSNHSFDLRSRPTLAIFGTSSLQYMHDYVDSAHSVIFTSYWQPLYKKKGFPHIGGYLYTDHVINYFLSPQLGLEHQQIVAAKAPDRKGYDLRGYFSAGGSLVFKKKTYYSTAGLREDLTAKLMRQDSWKKRSALELLDTLDKAVPGNTKELMEKRNWTKLAECSVSYAGRASIFHHQSNFDTYIPLFTAALTVYPVRTENFSFSFSYNNGANPIDGTLKQTYWLFSVNFKK